METIETIRARAEAGDPAAQYRLAAALSKVGEARAASEWLARAAAAGHPGAVYTTATELLEGRLEPPDIARAVALLEAAAAKGGASAARLLAVLKVLGLGVDEDHDGACGLLIAAARAGHPAAMRELAALGLASGGDPATGRALLRAAAQRGDLAAGVLGLRLGGAFAASEASALAAKLRAAGAPLLDSIAPSADDPRGVPLTPDGLVQFGRAARLARAPAPATETLHVAAPKVVAFRGALTPLECDYLVCAALPLLTRSAVVDSDAGGARQEAFRTSDGALISLVDLDLMLLSIGTKLAAMTGTPLANAEMMGVLRYRPGQEYKPHHDFLPEDQRDYSEVRRSGQRTHTLLVTLNGGFGGGETVFPRLGLSFKGAPGDGLHFENTDAQEAPLKDSQHAGAPVSAGEKWMLSIWIRARRFWFWRGRS